MANQQTPVEEITERVGEVLPGLAAAAKAVGLDNHRKALEDHRRRVYDSHKWMMGASGGESANMAGTEDMGDIIITGDIYGREVAERVFGKQDSTEQAPAEPEATTTEPEPATPTETTETQANTTNWMKNAALAAALLAGGASIPTAYMAWQSTQTPVAETPSIEMPKYDVEKWVPE